MKSMRIYVLCRRKLILTFLFLLGTGVVLTITQHFVAAPSLVRDPGTYYMANIQEKVIALTFDDGPDPIDTPEVLDILKGEEIRATFFILGEAGQLYPDLLKRLANEGHEIGNHGYSHDYQQRRLVEELRKTDEIIFAATGCHTYFYRPPGGFVNKTQLEIIKRNGHVVTLWSVDSKDWRNPGVATIKNNVLKDVVPGSIILMHDGGYHRIQTVKSLAPIIDELKTRGYRFVTLSELQTLESEAK